MKKIPLIAICLAAAGASSMCQAQAGSSAHNQHYLSPVAVVAKLQSQDARTRRQVSAKIGLSIPITGTPCFDFDDVESSAVEFIKGTESRLVVIRSQVCESLFLVPMIRLEGNWITLPAIALWAKYSTPSYRLESLISPEEKEIIVSNVTVDAGTGILQRNLAIYKVDVRGVRRVFDRPEFLHYSVPVHTARGDSHFEDEEKSAFRFNKNTALAEGLVQIDEKRQIRVGPKSVDVYRTYHWDKRAQAFQEFGDAPHS